MKNTLIVLLTAAVISTATAQTPSYSEQLAQQQAMQLLREAQAAQWWQVYTMTVYWYWTTMLEGGHIGP